MFILKGLFILFLFIFILGLIAAFWLKFKFRQIQRNFRKSQGMEEETIKKEKKTTSARPGKNLGDKGEYVDFEEVE
ncbi:MAG: hypothetical protein CVU05_05630 [Bacteroidetes bacterium HGW-Bacteroidetes-21]|jgi:cytoskeletal protein RodZ|nr:MAG: hypothetical protein CVU05_05630 [Bacteroidetes bacterium HGW-Bacteroidetes-21]